MYTLLLVCLVGMVVAQPPQPCTSPPSWEANIYESNEQEKFVVRARLSYDSTYRRERIIEDVLDGTSETYYDVLALYDSQIEFVYNFKARNCSRRTITRQWRDFGIPADARSYGEAYIGTSALPGLGLLVTMWGTNYTTPSNETIRRFGTWTAQLCLPVSQSILSSQYGRTQVSFYDITAGISNPDVFIPRRECLTEQEFAMRDKLFRGPSKRFHK